MSGLKWGERKVGKIYEINDLYKILFNVQFFRRDKSAHFSPLLFINKLLDYWTKISAGSKIWCNIRIQRRTKPKFRYFIQFFKSSQICLFWIRNLNSWTWIGTEWNIWCDIRNKRFKFLPISIICSVFQTRQLLPFWVQNLDFWTQIWVT